MSCTSLVLYLELCVFIYRKLPYPKKTTLIWINGAAPVGAQVHPERHPSSSFVIIQLECLCFQVIATMSCLGMWIPRAVMFTDMTSNWYVFLDSPKFL